MKSLAGTHINKSHHSPHGGGQGDAHNAHGLRKLMEPTMSYLNGKGVCMEKYLQVPPGLVT